MTGGSARANSLRGYIVLSLAWLTVTGAAFFLTRRAAPQPLEILPPPAATSTAVPTLSSPSQPTATPGPLRVDVAGAVQAPGVYRLPAGSIVADAIAAAGGPAPGAALDRLNKAVTLQDGCQVYVPRATETSIPTPLAPQAPVSATAVIPAKLGPSAALPAQPVDLNHARPEELEMLPGIGPALAARIVAGRPYGSVEDLLRVQGIGPAILDTLRPYATAR